MAIKLSIGEYPKKMAKKIVNDVYHIDIPIEDFYNSEKKEVPIEDYFIGDYALTIRRAVQYFAIDICMKEFGNNIWAQKLLTNILEDDHQVIIVPDVICLEEYECIKNGLPKNFISYTILVTRLETNSTSQNKHEMDDKRFEVPIDFKIENNGTLEDLEIKVNELYNMIFIN